MNTRSLFHGITEYVTVEELRCRPVTEEWEARPGRSTPACIWNFSVNVTAWVGC